MTIDFDYDEEKAAKYFTCQCNPAFESQRPDENGVLGGLWAHRIPIDCMTAEDWKRVAQAKQERAKTVWVVTVVGDEDCGAANDGLIDVYANKNDAWSRAFQKAQEHVRERSWDSDPEYDVSEEGISLYRSDVLVTKTEVL